MTGGKVRQYPYFVGLFHTFTPLRSVELSKKWRNSGFHGQGWTWLSNRCGREIKTEFWTVIVGNFQLDPALQTIYCIHCAACFMIFCVIGVIYTTLHFIFLAHFCAHLYALYNLRLILVLYLNLDVFFHFLTDGICYSPKSKATNRRLRM